MLAATVLSLLTEVIVGGFELKEKFVKKIENRGGIGEG